jgi:DNA-binding response OmpR family regulator
MQQHRVLVVDDQPDIVLLVKMVLKSAGYEVLTATNGQQALEIYEQMKPDVIVLDLNLPLVPGWEVCREIKSRSDTPILIMTGQAPTEGAARNVAQGANVYMVKPFDVDQLVENIQTLLDEQNAKTA